MLTPESPKVTVTVLPSPVTTTLWVISRARTDLFCPDKPNDLAAQCSVLTQVETTLTDPKPGVALSRNQIRRVDKGQDKEGECAPGPDRQTSATPAELKKSWNGGP